jgi:NAD(P)-dependent dehydrogenase (short-subunit alcohol dehydrogenase family)
MRTGSSKSALELCIRISKIALLKQTGGMIIFAKKSNFFTQLKNQIMKSLENKVAIITGAGSGIGKAISLLYAKEGAKVVVSDISEKGGNETVSEIKATGAEALFIKADTSKSEESKNLVEQTVKQFGALHIAVNNAGIGGPLAATGEYPIDGWDKVIAINLSGVFYGLRYQIPAMLKSGGGSIVNVASILGKVGAKGSPAYVAAKHGVIGLTEAAALEYADQKIRINSIGPGYILTPLLTNSLSEEAMKALVGLHPMGRLGDSNEVAELALWLNSDKASFVTGSYYNVDGGYLAQ